MLHDAPPAGAEPGSLSARERETLVAIAQAIMPAGKRFPGADVATVARMEGYLAQIGRSGPMAIRAILHAIDATAYARHLRAFSRLPLDKRYRLLESWRTGNYVGRTALRTLVTPLKLAHFDDPTFFQAIGCVYSFASAAPSDRPRHVKERTIRADDLPAGEELECDVVVVGTGAGGAVVARELAERGLAVVLLEEGEYHDRSTFSGRTAAMHAKLYRSMASTTTIGNTSIYVPVGRSVGGSTTINSGTCYRAPDRVFRHWRDDLGLTDFTPEHMAPYYERVEDVLQVAPGKKEHLGGAARVIARGADRLGYKHKPLLRNAPDCDGKGVCCFGCPTDAKRSTNVSYVPMALRAGAQLVVGAHVDRVTTAAGRATGVEGHATRSGTSFRVRARATVVACGTFQTPVLLERSGVRDRGGWLGGNLSLHPAGGVMAFFDEAIDGWNAIPQSYAIEEFHDEGILLEGGTAPADMAASSLPMLGARFMEAVEDFEHAAIFGFMMEDSSRGRVHVRNGRSVVSYIMNDNDVALYKRSLEILARVFFAAGARRVILGVHGFDEIASEADLSRFRRAHVRARDFAASAYHPLGTARMSAAAGTGVVGSDHQHHELPDLYVVDGSSVPSSLAVNPQVTIMALATRAADRLADRLV